MGRQGPCPGVLQENCRKVTRSVEDAEIKTNVLKQNSALLEVLGPAPPGPLLRSALGSAVPSAPSPRPELCARWGVVTWFYTIYS